MEKWNEFLNKGGKNTSFIKKTCVILSIFLIMYGLGYGVGTLLANIGF